jgi:uncharacterized protein
MAPSDGVVVRFGSHALAVEVADEAGEWGFGLMFRNHLGADAGMLFLFGQLLQPDNGFFMFKTLIPLQIAYLQSVDSRSYRVVALREMVPCRSMIKKECPEYDPGTVYDAAVEANRGWFTRAGVEVGDRATVESSTR